MHKRRTRTPHNHVGKNLDHGPPRMQQNMAEPLLGPFPYPLQGLRNPPKDFQSGNITGMLKTLQDQFVTVRLHAWLATRAGLQHLVCLGSILPGIAGFWIAIFGASGPVFDSSSLKNITLLDVQSARSFELFQLEIVIFWIPVELSWLARRLVVLAFHLWFRFRMLPGEARAGKGRNVTWWRRTEVVSRKGIDRKNMEKHYNYNKDSNYITVFSLTVNLLHPQEVDPRWSFCFIFSLFGSF